jgi:hypothetical protein
MGYSAKSLAQHLKNECLRMHGDSTKREYERGERYIELSNVFRGGATGAREDMEGAYHFTISEEEAENKYRSETIWRCTVYVTKQLEIVIEDCRGFHDGEEAALPRAEIIQHVLTCAVGAKP